LTVKVAKAHSEVNLRGKWVGKNLAMNAAQRTFLLAPASQEAPFLNAVELQ